MGNFRDKIRRVEPYVPGEQPGDRKVIKLNTNENPYPPAPGVAEALKNLDGLRLYPDPASGELKEAIARNKGLEPDRVFVGVGSDDVLAMSFLTFFNSDDPILFPDITYSFYDVWAELFRIPYERVAVREDFSIDPAMYVRRNGGIIFPNPNAPTGLLMPLSGIREILEANPDVIVIVDEAYIDFGGETAQPLLDSYDNLLVVQTFSKSRSMAGMRIGYAMGSKELIAALEDVKYSFNSYTMNLPSIKAGKASIEDDEYFRETVSKIINTREHVKKELSALGFHFPDSMANFIFASHESVPASDIFAAAKKAGIYLRYFNKPRIDNYLRITIGTDDEMESLLGFLKQYFD